MKTLPFVIVFRLSRKYVAMNKELRNARNLQIYSLLNISVIFPLTFVCTIYFSQICIFNIPYCKINHLFPDVPNIYVSVIALLEKAFFYFNLHYVFAIYGLHMETKELLSEVTEQKLHLNIFSEAF